MTVGRSGRPSAILLRESDVRRALAEGLAQQDALSFAVADLDRDEGWAEAAKGCRYVLHVASPLGLEAPRDPEVLIGPAREGARRVIHAAIAAGAERVVMTSSVSAVNEAGVESIMKRTGPILRPRASAPMRSRKPWPSARPGS